MIGNPKYKLGDSVVFRIGENEKHGEVVTVDKYGTFFDKSDVCYDLLCEEENIVYKHINQKTIIECI